MEALKLKAFFAVPMLWRVVIKVVKTGPLVQGEFIKFKFCDGDFDDFSPIGHEIAVAFAEERRHDRLVRLKSPFFPKEKFKVDLHSQKAINEQIAKQSKRRAVCIQTKDGATFRGLNVLNSPNKHWGIIVTNGQFPTDEDERPIPFVRIETLT